jgi:hypothetical protein
MLLSEDYHYHHQQLTPKSEHLLSLSTNVFLSRSLNDDGRKKKQPETTKQTRTLSYSNEFMMDVMTNEKSVIKKPSCTFHS